MPVVCVKYNIKTPADIEMIYPFLLEKVMTVKHVLPTTISRGGRYPYRNKEEMIDSFIQASNDAINRIYAVESYIHYVRRIFIASSLSPSNSKFYLEIAELKQLAEYIEVNKNEV